MGLAGVVVTLYRDANGDGLLQVATDTLVGDGDDGVRRELPLRGAQTAGGTYFVSAATPGGYTRTNPTVWTQGSQGTVAGGRRLLTADFG